MNHSTATNLARLLMNLHGLQDWTFAFDRAKRRAGRCSHRRKIISLSIHFVTKNPDDEIKDTILHEIAHALAGPGAGHGSKWKAVCRKIGAKPIRCYNSDLVKMPAGRYKAVCGGCQKVYHRHRKPNTCMGRFQYCPPCGQERGRLTFTKQEQNV